MEKDPKATEAAQLRPFDLGTWKAIELIAGHRTSSETIGVIAFDDLFDQLVLTARRIIAEQQIAVHRAGYRALRRGYTRTAGA